MPGELGIETSTYVNGMGRIHWRTAAALPGYFAPGVLADAERLLAAWMRITRWLVTDGLSGCCYQRPAPANRPGARIVERTRADLTMALREQQLQNALRDFEKPASRRIFANRVSWLHLLYRRNQLARLEGRNHDVNWTYRLTESPLPRTRKSGCAGGCPGDGSFLRDAGRKAHNGSD